MPVGTIHVTLRDIDDKPVTDRTISLGILIASVAEGESHSQVEMSPDGRGEAAFRGLETGTRVAYRVSVRSDGAVFAASPFRLPADHGVRVLLHVYGVTHDLARAGIYFDLTTAIDLRDDRFQIDEGINVYNASRLAWVPTDVRLPLTPNATGFRSQRSMSDQAFLEVLGDLELRGTYPPGRHLVVFSWQLPWTGAEETLFELATPPRTYAARFLAPAAHSLQLNVDGFPDADTRLDSQGHRLLVTERRWSLNDLLAGQASHCSAWIARCSARSMGRTRRHTRSARSRHRVRRSPRWTFLFQHGRVVASRRSPW